MANKKNMSVINEDDMPILDKVITENKWALFYCLPNKSLEEGLKLIHTDNDVHSFFADAESHEEDAGLRFLSSTSFSTMIKRKCGNTSKEGRKKKVKSEMVDDEPLGKAKMVEVEDVGLVQEKADVGKKEGVGRKVQGATGKVCQLT
ncbi:hypothetical protein Tco_0754809 [Tanacetum coccineum]